LPESHEHGLPHLAHWQPASAGHSQVRLLELHEKGTEEDIVVKVLLETVKGGVGTKGWAYIAFHFAAGNAIRKKHMSE